MADPTTYRQLSESLVNVRFTSELPDVGDDEKDKLEQYMAALTSRQASKFDAIVDLIKSCDRNIQMLEEEITEIKEARDSWISNKEKIVQIIKHVYQQGLIDNKIKGNKYQAVIRRAKPKLVDNWQLWADEDQQEYGLEKVTTVTRIRDGHVLEVKQEKLPDKDRLRSDLIADVPGAPGQAQLVQAFSLVYERRKTL
jgi:hypothetical protein